MTNDNEGSITYAAGWYADAAAPGTERYYDGNAWTAHVRPMVSRPGPVLVGTPRPVSKDENTKKWMIGGWIAAGVIVVGAVGAALGGGGGAAVSAADSSAAGEVAAQPVDEAVVAAAATVAVPPGLVRLTAADAASKLTRVGLVPSYIGEPDAAVIAVTPAGATEVPLGSPVVLTLAPKSSLTLGQQNAVRSAETYLSFRGFSRGGLIGQLEFEGYSREDATFAVDHVAPDWNVEAAQSAQAYIDFTSFSRQSLIDQLLFEEFTGAEAEFGVAAVGY